MESRKLNSSGLRKLLTLQHMTPSLRLYKRLGHRDASILAQFGAKAWVKQPCFPRLHLHKPQRQLT